MENQKQPQMNEAVQLLASLDATFLNCFYCISVNNADVRLQGHFKQLPIMLTYYDIHVQFKRIGNDGTYFYEGKFMNKGVTLEIVLTN